jgi:spermidine/putrescine-binding protein
MSARGVSRRGFLTASSALGGAALLGTLGGCSKQAADARVSFLNWQDYVDPTLLPDFTAKTGLAVGYETYESNDALEERLSAAGVIRKGGRKATTFDLVVPSTDLFRRLREADALQPLDTSVVTEALLANLTPEMRRLEVDTGNRYAIPWGTGTTGIGYDTTVFSTPPTWDVFADSAYAGKMSLLAERREAFAAALLALGKDPNTTTAADVDAAAERLIAFAANARFDSAGYLDALADGTVVAAQGYNTDVLQARKRNPKLAFTIPPQGGTRWVDLLCIPKDAPNADGANQLVAFYLDPKVAATNAAYNLVSTGNQAAREFVPAELLNDPAVFPPESVVAGLAEIKDLGAAGDLYDVAWDRVTKARA